MRIEAPIQANQAASLSKSALRAYPTLQVGQKAPGFVLPDADMDIFNLADLTSQKHVVLHFYPRDRSPGGILQATDFSDHAEQFDELDCEAVFITPDDCPTHAEFRDEHGLSLRLLSDEDCDVCRLYGAWGMRQIGESLRAGVIRSTFVIDKHGIIREIFRNVVPRGHVAEVLRILQEL